MWLRVGKRGRWSARDSGQASKDVTPREGENLSVFSAQSLDGARQIAAAYALTRRRAPDYIDFVWFGHEALTDRGLLAVYAPDPALARMLSERHHEICGLDSSELCRAFAGAILARNPTVERITSEDIAATYVKQLATHLDIAENLSPGWRSYLDEAETS